MIRGGLPISRDGDERYWRRRANRQVRKRRATRTALRWSAIVLAHVLIGSVVLFAGVRIFLQVTSAEEFSVQRIEVVGAQRASASSVEARLSAQLGRNLLDLNLNEVVALAAGDPWIEHASAKRVLPDTLRLEIRERVPLAVALIGGVAHLVDSAGFVIRPSGPGAADDLPVLTGLQDLEGQSLIDGLKRGVRLLQRLEQQIPGWTHEISVVDLARTDRVTIQTVDPGPTVLLDPNRIERNVADYLELRREIQRHVGVMDYVDLRWRDRISVMPGSSKTPTKES